MRRIWGIIGTSFLSVSSSFAFGGVFPETVASLDIDRYMGRWYEIASTKPSFQKDCICVTADYALTESDTVSVTNSCRKKSLDGPVSKIVGSATVTNEPGKFNVSFGNFRLPFSNYWVIDLADDYSYAVVTTPFSSPIWILSRTPELSPDIKEAIFAKLKLNGFNVNKIQPTLQEGCQYGD